MGTGTRALIGAGAIAAAIVLFIVFQDSGSDDDSEPATTTAAEATAETEQGGNAGERPDKPPKPEEPEIPTIEIRNGQPVGGIAELEYDVGDKIEFYVDSDVTDHVHLHGYDVMKDVTAGQRIKFSVPATLDGVYEAELEDSVVPIAEITVNPG
ncbi:MAG TPA: hypothetical protein VHF58_07670 [Solirubrobacterales bacterium]|nr:hypothetical protein [Solirubrobacterales bacterium]